MNFLQIVVAVIILYLCIYALINRVCKCIEHCATARAYSKFRENGVLVKMDDVEAGIQKSNKEKKMSKKRFCKIFLHFILIAAAVVVLMIAIAFIVAFIGWYTGAPLPN